MITDAVGFGYRSRRTIRDARKQAAVILVHGGTVTVTRNDRAQDQMTPLPETIWGRRPALL